MINPTRVCMAEDDVVNGIVSKATEAVAGKSAPSGAAGPRPALSSSQRHARAAARTSNGKFAPMPRPPKPEPPKIAKRVRSRVTNGAALFIHGQATSAESRRFTDILRAVIADLGGADAPLSEAQKQIARRAASLSVSCEKLEEIILAGATSAAEQAFMSAAGGLSPYVVLRECLACCTRLRE